MTRMIATAELERRHREAIALGRRYVAAARRQLALALRELGR